MSEEVIENYATSLADAKSNGDVKRQLEIIDSFVENVMNQGEDYGLIPGIPKPTLFKSGAEKLAALFEVKPKKEVTSRYLDLTIPFTIPDKYKPGTDKDKRIIGLVAIEVTCTLIDKSGDIAGSGLGACTNIESKFAQHAGAVYNNVIKMAGKRAYVDSILTISLVSGRFTQDMEDADRDDIKDSGTDNSSGDDFIIPFGQYQNKPLSEVPDSNLTWYRDAAAKSVADPTKAAFKIKNKVMLDAINKEIAKRAN